MKFLAPTPLIFLFCFALLISGCNKSEVTPADDIGTKPNPSEPAPQPPSCEPQLHCAP